MNTDYATSNLNSQISNQHLWLPAFVRRVPASLRVSLLLSALLVTTATANPARVTTVDGKTVEGDWGGVDVQGRVIVQAASAKPKSIAPADVMDISFSGPQSQPAATSRPADGVTVYLSDASEFDARLLAGSADSIELQTDLVPRLKLRLSSLAAIRFSAEDLPAAAKAFNDALAQRDPTQDTLFILQDTRVSPLRGLVESLDANGGSFKWRQRSMHVDRSRAYGIVFATGAGVPPSPQVHCTLADGSTWAGKLDASDKTGVKLVLGAGPAVELPANKLTSIRFRNDRVRFLSDLEPAKYEFTPWGATRWPFRKDLSVAGHLLRIGGQQFDRGIGVHSQCELDYALTEPFRQFAATIGLDEAVGSRGNVVFRVLADGRELFNSGPVTGRDPARPVLVSLNGAKTLQLRVEFGDDLDVADQADWGAARLIK